MFNHLPQLSQSETFVYNYIINHQEDIVSMTIQDLAKVSNTSTATILRLCRKLGCEGYSELRYDISHSDFSVPSENGDVKENSFLDLRYFFNTTISSDHFQDSINEAADIIAHRHLVLFVGKGASNILGEYGSCYFSSFFRMSLRVEDIASYPINYFPPELIKDCCIIVCSISGTYADEIAYVKNYHTKGCKLIAITANEKSVLGVMSDVCVSYTLPLIMESDQNLTSQVPCCYIIELLASRTREILLRNNHSTTM